MKKTVVLSTNANPDYYKYLPYTQKAWNKLGWDTLTILSEGFDSVVESMETYIDPDFKNEIILQTGLEMGSYRTETQVQVSRLFAGKYIEDGMVMLGDVDMIPLANYWNPTADHITVYGFDLTGRSQYPICYIAMTAEKWRRMIPEKTMPELLNKYPNAKSDDFYKWWGVDQEIITERINQRKEKDELVLIDRGFTNRLAKGRVDRAAWEQTINSPDQKIDAHCLRPFNLEETERIMKLIQP